MRQQGKRGFTIVELLIVIVVIAILAAISVVAYNGIVKRVNATAAMQQASQAARKVAVYFTEHEVYPPDLLTVGVTDDGLQYSSSSSASSNVYCITSTRGNESYLARSTQSAPVEGVCPGHLEGGLGSTTPPPLASWHLVGGALYEVGTGIIAGSAALTSPTFTFSQSAQSVQWVDGADQQPGVRIVLRFLRQDGSTISSVQVRTSTEPTRTAIVEVPSDTAQFVILTTGTASGKALSHGGYLYFYG